MEPEKPLEDGLKKAYEDMLLVMEGAVAELLEAYKKVKESRWGREVPKVVEPVFGRVLEKKVDRIFKRAAFPRGLELERDGLDICVGGCKLRADGDTARSLVRDVAGFSPDLVLEMVWALEKTASELLQAIEDARRVALRVGRRCLGSPAMKEIARRAALRRMGKA
jgi:hypothetical protein